MENCDKDRITYPFFFTCCQMKPKRFLNYSIVLIMITSIVLLFVDLAIIISLSMNKLHDLYIYIALLDIFLFRIPKLVYSTVIFW